MTETAVKRRKLNLKKLILKSGAHRSAEEGMCVMEAVAYVAGRPHTDSPPCASPVIGEFLREWNDAMNDEDRQILKPFIPRIINTKSTEADELTRSWMALDWYCRVSAPAWLRLAGLEKEAKAIEATKPIVDSASAKKAQKALDAAAIAARAARAAARAAAGDAAWAAAGDAARAAAGDAAWAAARDAAWDAAWDAARAAARAAAGDAAWAAAGDAAWAAAGDAARAAAWDAARAAAGDAAWDAAWDAARAAAGAAAWDAAGAAAGDAARAAAGDAARAALRPTVVGLQQSALSLLDRMIAVTEEK